MTKTREGKLMFRGASLIDLGKGQGLEPPVPPPYPPAHACREQMYSSEEVFIKVEKVTVHCAVYLQGVKRDVQYGQCLWSFLSFIYEFHVSSFMTEV